MIKKVKVDQYYLGNSLLRLILFWFFLILLFDSILHLLMCGCIFWLHFKGIFSFLREAYLFGILEFGIVILHVEEYLQLQLDLSWKILFWFFAIEQNQIVFESLVFDQEHLDAYL